MSEQNLAETSAEPVSDSALFYPQENATTDTDSTGTTVEAEAVEVDNSAIDEVADVEANADADSASVEDAENVDESEDSSDSLYFEVNGKEVSVKDVQEGLDNGLRQSDYTKKTQALAEERKTVEADKVKAVEAFEKLNGHIEALELSFKKEEATVDWDHLREYDTAEYLRLKEEHETKQSLLDSAKADAQKLKEDANTAHITSEQEKLIGFFPDWTDPATGLESREKDAALINSYVADNGFSNDEFEHLTSANVMLAIHKAAKFDALRAEGDAVEKQVRKAPKAIKPSAKKTKQKSKSAVTAFYGEKYGTK